MLQNTRQEFIVNHGNALMNEVMNADVANERVDECITASETIFQVTEHPAHRC